MQFSVQKEFGKEIVEIWENEGFDSIELIERGFAVQDNILQDCLMFIGINPSFGGNSGNIFYDAMHGKTHKYFKKFIDISSEIEIEWTHLDLLFLRETSQQTVKNIGKTGLGHIFFDMQLSISKKIIEAGRPKIIIVNNAFARDLLHSDLFSSDKFKFEFDDLIGTYRIVNNDFLNGTPVFFTSMLTGQRALDLGSYRRLIWHIKHVLKALAT